MFERRAELFLERAEPLLEAAPLLGSFGGDRSTHLLRTGRTDRPLRLVKAQASFVKWQIEIVQQAPDHGFRLGNQLLVDDSMYGARVNLVKMPHQSHIFAIV